jgi:hypothetical protein
MKIYWMGSGFGRRDEPSRGGFNISRNDAPERF